MLPGLDGFAALDRLRLSGTMVPVVFLTTRDGVADRVAHLTMDEDTREVRRGERLLTLTPTEYEVLGYVVRRPPSDQPPPRHTTHTADSGPAPSTQHPARARHGRARAQASGARRVPGGSSEKCSYTV